VSPLRKIWQFNFAVQIRKAHRSKQQEDQTLSLLTTHLRTGSWEQAQWVWGLASLWLQQSVYFSACSSLISVEILAFNLTPFLKHFCMLFPTYFQMCKCAFQVGKHLPSDPRSLPHWDCPSCAAYRQQHKRVVRANKQAFKSARLPILWALQWGQKGGGGQKCRRLCPAASASFTHEGCKVVLSLAMIQEQRGMKGPLSTHCCGQTHIAADGFLCLSTPYYFTPPFLKWAGVARVHHTAPVWLVPAHTLSAFLSGVGVCVYWQWCITLPCMHVAKLLCHAHCAGAHRFILSCCRGDEHVWRSHKDGWYCECQK